MHLGFIQFYSAFSYHLFYDQSGSLNISGGYKSDFLSSGMTSNVLIIIAVGGHSYLSTTIPLPPLFVSL